VPLGRVDSYQCARLAFDVQEALNLHGACVFGHKLPAPRTAVQQSRPCGRQAPAREEDGDKQINDGKKKPDLFGINQIQKIQTATFGRFSFCPSVFDPGGAR
jgi:hypothetical protein